MPSLLVRKASWSEKKTSDVLTRKSLGLDAKNAHVDMIVQMDIC